MNLQNPKIALVIVLISLPMIWWACEEPVPHSIESGVLLFEDEFDGTSLDLSKWKYDIGRGNNGWGNQELQFYKAENTTVSNGTAKITVKKDDDLDYTSSKIKTDGRFTSRYGKVQARIKTVKGKGLWPAFWLLPSHGDWPCDGEIDIMEQGNRVALDPNNYTSNESTGAAHLGKCPYSGSTHDYESFHKKISYGSYADYFHVYEIRWEPNRISWYIDDEYVFQVTPNSYPSYTWPFNLSEWYLIINLAIDSGGPNEDTQFPSQMEIDWVRWYSLEHDN